MCQSGRRNGRSRIRRGNELVVRATVIRRRNFRGRGSPRVHVSLFLAVRALNDPGIPRFLCLLRGARIPLVYPRALNGRWAIRANGLRAPVRFEAPRSGPGVYSLRVLPSTRRFSARVRGSGYSETFDFDHREAARQYNVVPHTPRLPAWSG